MSDNLPARILARVVRARDEANAATANWTRLYAEALDDIAQMVDPPTDDVAAGLAHALVGVGIFDYVDGEPRDEQGLAAFIRDYLAKHPPGV